MVDLDLTNRTTVITGGSSGIGKAIAYKFAEHGSDIVLVDKNEKDGLLITSEIENKYRRKSSFILCDISNEEKVLESCKKIISEFKKVDNLVCAAGYGSNVSLETMDIAEWKKTLDINLNGTFYFVHSLIKNMLENKKGNIVIIGSATVETGSGGGIHYAATKTAQYGIVKGLAYEFLSKGIRTNVITPHLIDTPMLRKRYPDTPENNHKLAARVPIGRIGTAIDIANIALFLASDESSYVCGAEIVADG
ncbi:MAG: SDR family oxidoreductase, partial [Actinobacteria bacterium]|nr:SDR family oxidoreductase [Actinomycetota bacterium]